MVPVAGSKAIRKNRFSMVPVGTLAELPSGGSLPGHGERPVPHRRHASGDEYGPTVRHRLPRHLLAARGVDQVIARQEPTGLDPDRVGPLPCQWVEDDKRAVGATRDG